MIKNQISDNENELYVDRDIMVLANPEIAKLPNWVIALVAAGGLAAALSTAAGLLLVISTSVAHDLVKRIIMERILKKEFPEKSELLCARVASSPACLASIPPALLLKLSRSHLAWPHPLSSP